MRKLYVKLGKLLQLERQRQHIDIADLSEELKIPVDNLESIETGDIDSLPSELYFNLFAKSYAEYLRIDYVRTVEAITQDIEESQVEGELSDEKALSTGTHREQDSRPSTTDEEETSANQHMVKRLLKLTAAAVALLVVFLVVYTLLDNSPSPQGDENKVVEGLVAVDSIGDRPAETSFDFTGYDWNTPPYEKPSNLVLTMMAHQESWGAVIADGDTAIFRNLIPWKKYSVEARYRLVVWAGIPSQIEITLNGQRVDLADPGSRRISQVEINQVNVATFLNRPLRTAAREMTSKAGEPEPDTSNETEFTEETPAEILVDSI